MSDLEKLLPPHKCELTLTHNSYKNEYFRSAAEWIKNNRDSCSWENDEAMFRAAESGHVWTLQWYPDTPISFVALAAPTLDELLAWAQSLRACP